MNILGSPNSPSPLFSSKNIVFIFKFRIIFISSSKRYFHTQFPILPKGSEFFIEILDKSFSYPRHTISLHPGQIAAKLAKLNFIDCFYSPNIFIIPVPLKSSEWLFASLIQNNREMLRLWKHRLLNLNLIQFSSIDQVIHPSIYFSQDIPANDGHHKLHTVKNQD